MTKQVTVELEKLRREVQLLRYSQAGKYERRAIKRELQHKK